MNTKKLPLAFWIFVGLVIGIVAGLALMAIPGGVDFAKTYVKPVAPKYVPPLPSPSGRR